MTKKIVPPFVRNPYNYDTSEVSDETGLKCEDESKAKQSFAEEVDINTIVRRFGLTGQIPNGVRMPMNADFEEVFDLQSALNAVNAARESFMTMPAEVRSRFGNDPAAFVNFCSDPENIEEARRLGLVPPLEAAPAAAVAAPAAPSPTST